MRIMCPHCGSRAIITSSNKLSNQVSDLYCQCKNLTECGGTFVSTLAFKHTINPPARTTTEMAMNLLNRLSIEEKAALQESLN